LFTVIAYTLKLLLDEVFKLTLILFFLFFFSRFIVIADSRLTFTPRNRVECEPPPPPPPPFSASDPYDADINDNF
jgi:hypothetical protein